MSNTKLWDMAIERLGFADKGVSPETIKASGVSKVRNKALSYPQRHRGTWFRPEYDFDEIQIAQDTDSYFFRAIKKKVDRFVSSGHQFVSVNDDALRYVQLRIAEMEMAANYPWTQLVADIVHDMFRYSNSMLIKVRDTNKSSGSKRVDIRGVTLDPVAGYFLLPFETLEFKSRSNGEIKKVMQKMPNGEKKEFFPQDIVHFFANRKPGFTVGTPEAFPALDDIALLRRIEENVEELIETNLFPVFHYKVGSDAMPERNGPNGMKETDLVKDTIEYMPAGGVYISDHRHEIQAIGSESKALRIDFYLSYFKNRVFAALGVSGIDMGEGSANRSTASTLSKSMMMDVEAMQVLIKRFIEFYIINEILMEGGWNPLDPEEKVEIQFGVVNREERLAVENQTVQLFLNNLYTETEARSALGKRPIRDEDRDGMQFKLYTEPGSLAKGMFPGSAVGEILAGVKTSNVSAEAVANEKAFVEKHSSVSTAPKSPGGTTLASKAAAAVSEAKSKPSNQHGTRSSAKLARDQVSLRDGDESYTIALDYNLQPDLVVRWSSFVYDRHNELVKYGVRLDTVMNNLLPRLNKMHEESNEKS
jgi:hypothetical protein